MADLKSSVVRVLRPDGGTVGTGFVAADGLIITCAHVVRAASAGPGETVRVIFPAIAEGREAQVHPEWWRNPDAEDVAVLFLPGLLPPGASPLPLGSSADTFGRTFSTFGFPTAKPVEGMAGRCEVVGHTTEGGFPVLQLRSTEISPGFSGAPVWDDNLGVVVGMVVSITRPDPYGRMTETAFIIPVETLRQVCPALQLPEGEPYRGLQVFEAEHADLYFGREAATRELLDALSKRDIVILVGVSGSGKSSLVRAGLEKGLREHPVPGLAERVRCLMAPGREPLLNLALALSSLPSPAGKGEARSQNLLFDLPPDALVQANLPATAGALNRRSPQALAKSLQACAPPEGLLLIVDQFERLYTECPDEATRSHFVETLLAAAGERVKVLLALRADYYGLALEHRGLERVVKQGGQVTLGRMSEAELRAAIELPARAMGRSLQPGLADRLIADVRERAGDLPLLEFALTEIWKRDNQKGVLTLATYEALGYDAPDGERFPGVRGAIARYAEAIWQELDDEERRVARRIFLTLVTPGPVDERGEQLAENASGRARWIEWDETTRRVAARLVDARLLTTGQDPLSGQPVVEVAHEALLRAWPRLRQWLADYRPFLRWYHGDLAPFLRRWLDKGRHRDFLLPEIMLAQAQHWLSRCPEELSGPPAEYIRASVAKRDQARAARERLRQRVVLGLAAGLLVTVALAVLSGLQWRRADEQRQVALARQWAAVGQLEFDRSPESPIIGTVLGIESLRTHPTLEGDQLLRRGLDRLPQVVARMRHEGLVTSVAFSPDRLWVVSGSSDGTVRVWETTTGREVSRMTHDGPVLSVAFSPDGRRIVSGSADETARVWEAHTGREIARMTHAGPVGSVAFSPNGQWVASGSGLMAFTEDGFSVGGRDDRTVRVWEASTGREVSRVEHDDYVMSVVFSPDGRYVVSGSLDGTIWIWEAATGNHVARMAHGDYVLSVALCPDTQWAVSGGSDWTARVWEIETGKEIARMAHGGPAYSVVCSPDGQWVLSGSEDRTARVWGTKTGQEVARIEHGGPVTSVAFGPDKGWVASGSKDRTVRVWEAATGREISRRAHSDWVWSTAFSPDAQLVVSGSKDGAVQIWKAEAKQEIIRTEQRGWVFALDSSLDGRWVVSGGEDGIARVWEVETGREIARKEHDGRIWSVAFSPNGDQVVSGGEDRTVRVWEAATGQEIARMTHDDTVYSVSFSPEGQYVASGSWDKTARVWRVATGEEMARMKHEDLVYEVAFSPDGQYVVSGGRDGTARVWKALTGEEVARITHNKPVWSVAFSPDGQYVISGDEGGMIRVWNMERKQEMAWVGHNDAVYSLAFSPSGQWVVSGSRDGTLRIWETKTGQEVARMAHGYWVGSVAFSPDGQWVVSGSLDHTVRIWRAETGQEITRMVHNDAVGPAAFSPNGQYVVSGSKDGTMRVWLWRAEDLIAEACRRLPRNLTRQEWNQYIGTDIPYHLTCPDLPEPEK